MWLAPPKEDQGLINIPSGRVNYIYSPLLGGNFNNMLLKSLQPYTSCTFLHVMGYNDCNID